MNHFNLSRFFTLECGFGDVTVLYFSTWWLIPLSKWVITPVINGISRVNPLITGVTHLLSGMSHQVDVSCPHHPPGEGKAFGHVLVP